MRTWDKLKDPLTCILRNNEKKALSSNKSSFSSIFTVFTWCSLLTTIVLHFQRKNSFSTIHGKWKNKGQQMKKKNHSNFSINILSSLSTLKLKTSEKKTTPKGNKGYREKNGRATYHAPEQINIPSFLLINSPISKYYH